MQDGFIDYKGFKTYFKIYGDESLKRTPLLVLHGGPGSTHHYMQNLHKLTKTGRRVIFYDQFGSGQSDGKHNKHLWKVKTFVEQLDSVRDDLGLSDIYLLGHSWGGMLAIEYMLSKPQGVRGVILSSAMIDMHLFQEEVDRLVDDLPADTQEIIRRHHEAGTVDDDEYKQAFKAYNDKYIFRGKQWPKEVKTPKGAFNTELYRTMWGLSEANTRTGTLKDWSRIDELDKIQPPVLITSGEYDELTPRQAKITQERIPNSELIVFKEASHCHHIEDEKAFLDTVSRFMDKYVGSSSGS